MSRVLMTLLGRWGAGLAGWSIASTIIWEIFPLVPALQPLGVRTGAILLLLAAVLGINGFKSLRARRRRRALTGAIAGESADGRDPEAGKAEEVARLRERMKAALARLKGQGRRRLYEQPWFVIIGPPGAGKSTALLNAGLHLPLGQGDESPAVSGVGGTRQCDWWFTEEAVLIDTAGRYTTQDSDRAVDEAGWLGFLDMLRRTRPRQPINGVLVVLSVIDLATINHGERAAHAKAVRLRLDEVAGRLGARVPVYVLLSKADQIRGFTAYFDDLDQTGRSQVWGLTLPLDKGVGAFVPEFRLLLGRLEERLVERLQGERAAERRAQIGAFPLQVASLEAPLTEFMTRAFTGSRLDPAPFLRGVYLTSATQQGTPIDRLTGMMARSFGVDQMRAPALRPVSGRGYFLNRLVREVVLGEALLASRNPGRDRRRRLVRTVGFSCVVAVAILGGVVLWRAQADNQVAVTQADEAIAAYRQRLSDVKLDPVASSDLARVAPVLDAAGALPRAGAGWVANLVPGLSQGDKIAASDRLAYGHALERILLPRLILRLEQQMRTGFATPDVLYGATRVYLMLGGAGPLSAPLIESWFESDWEARFPGALNAELRDHLRGHLEALLAEPLPEVALDGALVEAARATFSRVPLAERVYGRLRAAPAARAVLDWSPASALGPDGRRLFVRPSGRPLTDGIPGFFTAKGFQAALLADLPSATREAAQESWVLGHAEQVPTEGPSLLALEDGVVALYAADVQKRWSALLDDLSLAPFRGQEQTIRDLYVLSSPQSPLRDMLTAIAAQLRFTMPDDPGKSTAPAPGAAPAGASAGAKAPPALPPALTAVVDHFRPLLDLAGPGGAPTLDAILKLVNGLQQILATAVPGGPPSPATLQSSGDPAQLLIAEAERQPVPVAGWLRQIAASGSTILGSATHAAASAAFSTEDGPGAACHAVVDGHYPFDAGSTTDAPIDDFARLFAPGGLFDAFYQAQVKPFVDTRGAVWQPHTLGGVPAPIDAATVAVFQRIAAIREAYFPAGPTPQVSFSLSPVAGSDPNATLTIGGTAVSKDPDQAASFSWPGGGGLSAASLAFDAPPSTSPLAGLFGGGSAPAPASNLQFGGTWALFRLLGRGHLAPTRSPTLFDLSFDVDGKRAAYRLQAGSGHNPFARNLLLGFRCPVIR